MHPDTTVAHLHLHVPDLGQALNWFEGLGFARNLLLPDFGMADMGTGAPYTHRLAMNLWAGRSPASSGSSARLLSYRLETSDLATFEAARLRLTTEAATGNLTGPDPAGVTLYLGLTAAADCKEQAA